MSNTITYPIMETFYSIQGEGAFQGNAAFFIRFGGCDVGCSWCDVKESWNAEDHPFVSLDEIVKSAVESGTKVVIVTGGEPMMYQLKELTTKLKEKGLRCHLETSGAYPITGDWDWICFSPKKFKKPLEEIYPICHELKVVVLNKHDMTWAEKHADKTNAKCQHYLQPEWDKSEAVTPMILNYIHDNPKWRVSLQVHKFLGIR